MLLREFLKHVSPTMSVTAWDLDAQPGNNRKDDEAGALAIAHHFDYNAIISDFAIGTDKIIIWYKRK